MLRKIIKLKLAALVALTAFVVLAAGVAGAQPLNRPSSPKGWSDLVHSRYLNIKTMHATFEQIIMHKESGIEENRTGNLYFKKPFLVRWVSDAPYPEELIVDEKFLWQYFPEEELALKFKVENIDDQSEFLSVLTGRAPLMDKFKIIPKDEVEGVQTLKLLPFTPSTSLVEATIWVDMESGLILRLLFSDFYGNQNDIAFTDQKLDTKIDNKRFKFDLPPDTFVEDYTK